MLRTVPGIIVSGQEVLAMTARGWEEDREGQRDRGRGEREEGSERGKTL